MRFCVFALELCLAFCLFAGADEPVIAKSLAKLEKSPPDAATSFEFVVTGDSQSNRQLVMQSDVFKGMIQEWNILKPAFAIEVGDLILGGSADGLPQQWDLFVETIAKCEPPYFPVPGNHDISDAASEQLWMDRMGPVRYAFSYGNSRFIVLDSEEIDALDRLSDAQVAWFKQELESTKAANIFVFLHQPYWTTEHDPEKNDETWEKRWRYLADVMHGHPVRAVFAGHIHCYRDFGIRDGVHYVICGGAASLGNGPTDLGKFNHYLLVRVHGEDVSWSVIRAGSVLPSDVTTADRIGELADTRRRLVACDDVEVASGEPFDRDITIRVTNPFEKPFDSTLSWEAPKGWAVEPGSRDYSVAANGSVALTFHVRADSPEVVRFPAPVYATRYLNAKYGPPVELKVELPLVPLADAVRVQPAGVNVDGVLDEWKDAAVIPLTYYSDVPGGKCDPADLGGSLRAMWDDEHLYIAFDITDNDHYQPYGGDIVWLADAIEFGIDRWAWSFALLKTGPQVFAYFGNEVSAETVNNDVPLAIRRDAGHTIYEAAFPARLVKPLALKAGSDFRFRAEVADVDNGGPKHTLSMSPGGDGASGIRIQLKE